MENMSWERSFNTLWKKYENGKLVGVASASIRFWDLRYFDSPLYDYKNYSKPDKIAINGPEAWTIMKNTGNDMKNCISVEALRYLHLCNKESFAEQKGKTKKIIIMGDFIEYTTDQMLRQVNKAFNNTLGNLEFWFKPHPNNDIDLSLYKRNRIKLFNGSVENIKKSFNVGICSVYTSSALDLYCSGIHVIGYLDPINVNFSPLKDIENQQFFSDYKELEKIINSINFEKKKRSISIFFLA